MLSASGELTLGKILDLGGNACISHIEESQEKALRGLQLCSSKSAQPHKERALKEF